MSKILIIGDGLLGSEIHSQTGWDIISRKKDGFDITDKSSYIKLLEVFDGVMQKSNYDVIVNCIANTDTYSKDRQAHWDVNYKGVSYLVDFCNEWNIKLVHISTDYVYANSTGVPSEEDVPVHQETYYAYTKLLADGYIELKSNKHLIIRATHKASPFKHPVAWINQIGNFDYVNTIAELIVKLITKQVEGIYNVGTDVKTMYELAIQTNKTVRPEMIVGLTPPNTQMDIKKLKDVL